MSINALYLSPFPQNDTTTSKLRISVKTSGNQSIFSSCMLIQLVTTSLPPITTTSNYMTIFHAGTDTGSGLGIFLKYTNSQYYIGVRYIVKSGTAWVEVPGSFINLSTYSTNIDNDPFLLLFSYNITSSTTPNLTFSIVNFSPFITKTQPDFTLNYTFSNTNITSSGQWGFGSSPQTNTSQYGLLTTNQYNSYSAAGIYLTYLQSWTSYINATSGTNNTYALFNTVNSSFSIYSIMRANNFIPFGTTNLVFQLRIPNTTIDQLNNNVTNPVTLVTLTNSSTSYQPLPSFGVNATTTGTSYISLVQNAIACILKGMKVLTVNGYKLIEDLTLDDKLIKNDGSVIDIVKIKSFQVKPNEKTIPLIIKKGTHNAIEDLYISEEHKICIDNHFVLPTTLNLPKMRVETEEPIYYYHIETPDYLEDNIIVNGVTVETYTSNWKLTDLKK